MVSQTPPTLSRRQFLGSATLLAALGGAYYFGVHKRGGSDYLLKHSRTMMGTIVNFNFIGPDERSCREILEQCAARIDQLGFCINRYDQESPLSELNRSGVIDNPDPTLVKVVKMALEMSELTDGAFDPTVLPLLGLYGEMKKTGKLPPEEKVDKTLQRVGYRHVRVSEQRISFDQEGMGMTLDGIGKGYVVDEAVRLANSQGFANVCIEAGGDLMVTGERRPGTPWTIGIRNPRPEEGDKQFIVKMRNRAIATSGDYERAFSADRKYHHIINPATGFSPPELASCSIIAPTVAQADGLATSAMVLGHERSLPLLESLDGCEGFLIGKDLTTYSTKDMFT